MDSQRRISGDWYPGTIPENVIVDETAYVETTFSFYLYRSQEPVGVRIGRGASTYLGTMFDAGPRGRIILGDYALVHGARIICDAEVEIGDYALISWNVVLMDTYRLSFEPALRRRELESLSLRSPRYLSGEWPGASGQQAHIWPPAAGYAPLAGAHPIRIGPNVWIGFDSCVLPGVTIGAGAIVGARSVVAEDVPAYTVVAGNPARIIRRLDREVGNHGA
jgi:acetyltransferase-like isoleucine patch superfamily enzyme